MALEMESLVTEEDFRAVKILEEALPRTKVDVISLENLFLKGLNPSVPHAQVICLCDLSGSSHSQCIRLPFGDMNTLNSHCGVVGMCKPKEV